MCRLKSIWDEISDNDTLLPEIIEVETIDGRLWFVIDFSAPGWDGRVSIPMIRREFEEDFDYMISLNKREYYNRDNMECLIPNRLRIVRTGSCCLPNTG